MNEQQHLKAAANFLKKLERAGIGQWPNLLAVCAANGV